MLTILSVAKANGKSVATCICECGNETKSRLDGVISGHAKSCGCWNLNGKSKGNYIDGSSKTREYHIWKKMISRCFNAKNSSYNDYGGRGITVCYEWATSFNVFYNDMGSSPSMGHTLDRKNNDGNYCKENCRWATKTEQANNTRRNNIIFYKDVKYTKTELCNILKVTLPQFSNYAKRKGRSVEDAIIFYAKRSGVII